MLQAANFRFKGSSKADTTADIRHYIHIYIFHTKAGYTEKEWERDGDKQREREESIFFGGLIFGRWKRFSLIQCDIENSELECENCRLSEGIHGPMDMELRKEGGAPKVWLDRTGRASASGFRPTVGVAKEPAKEKPNESAICINYVCIFLVARLSTRQRRLNFWQSISWCKGAIWKNQKRGRNSFPGKIFTCLPFGSLLKWFKK